MASPTLFQGASVGFRRAPVDAPVLPTDPRSRFASEDMNHGPCKADRVVLAGGELASLIVHPEIVTFERMYRRLPEGGMFDATVSPNRPFQFELGAFKVPDLYTLILFDMRPDIYRLSGLDPGDAVPVESRRFSNIMGFSINVDQHQQGNVDFQLDPVAIQTTAQQAFTPQAQMGPGSASAGFASLNADFVVVGPGAQPPPAASFNIAQANSFAAAGNVGTALLPQRPTRYGPLNVPFTFIARSNSVVQLNCLIFRRLPSPVAFFEYDIAGMLVPELWIDQIIECSKPLTRVPL